MSLTNDLFSLLAAHGNKDKAWFDKPLDQVHIMKDMTKWINDDLSKFGGLLTIKTDQEQCKEVLDQYVVITCNFVDKTLKSNDTLQKAYQCAALPTRTGRGDRSVSDGKAGQVLWRQYPAIDADGFQAKFDALPSEVDKKACKFYQGFTRELLMYESTRILSNGLQLSVRLAHQENEDMTWADLVELISADMPTRASHDLLKSVFILRRKKEHTLLNWTEAFAVLTGLLIKNKTPLPVHVLYRLWDGQVPTHEKAAGTMPMPRTIAEKNAWSFSKYAKDLKVTGKKHPPFDPTTVTTFTSQMLVAQTATGAERPPPAATNQPRTPRKQQQQNPADGHGKQDVCRGCNKLGHLVADCNEGYDCHACGIFHAPGKHTREGQKKIKDGAKNKACFHCKKVGHFMANCPDKDTVVKKETPICSNCWTRCGSGGRDNCPRPAVPKPAGTNSAGEEVNSIEIETVPETEADVCGYETFSLDIGPVYDGTLDARSPEFQMMMMSKAQEFARADLLRNIQDDEKKKGKALTHEQTQEMTKKWFT